MIVDDDEAVFVYCILCQYFSLFIYFCEPKANCKYIAELNAFVLDVDFDYNSNGLVFISFADFIHLTCLPYVRGIVFLML